MEHRSTPPPAQNLLVLSADLLAVATRRIVEQLATAPSWEPMAQLKNALDVYESVRLGEIVNGSGVFRAARETSHDHVPATVRSVHHG